MEATQCMYCSRDQRLADLMAEVAKLNSSTLYLLKDQSFPGRCVVAFDEHKTEIHELNGTERDDFFADVAAAAEAVADLFEADKLHYAVFGDLVPHLHVHIVPKRKDGPLWGQAFNAEPLPPSYLSEEQLQERVERIAGRLEEA